MGKKKEENPLAMMMMGGGVKDNKSYKELSSKPKNYQNNSAPRKITSLRLKMIAM